MDTVRTVRVKTDAVDNPDGFYCINEDDFDKAVHELHVDSEETPAKPAKPEKAPAPAKPARVPAADPNDGNVVAPVKKRIGRPPGPNAKHRPKPKSKIRGRPKRPPTPPEQPELSIVKNPPPDNWESTIGTAEDLQQTLTGT